ncbi:MAG TPA: phosphatase PAP2 family protein [Rhizomicrobium sp.]|jgi:acid phosphatase (class A)|nr:phosphatase PAP2 family protein [Rhizomicrobium sp.]
MTNLPKLIIALSVVTLTGGLAFAAGGGYLAPSSEPDVYATIGAYPQDGSPELARDKKAYDQTRKLKDTPRWALAISDVSKKPADIAKDFSCAVGTELDSTNAPHLIALIAKMQKDASGVSGPAKDKYKRSRPFLDNDAPICEERTAEKPNDSYPSGHTTMIWSVGLMLAHIVPDRADAILARTRAYGESRVVCGVHWLSDVEAGRVAGSVTYQALSLDPAFNADMEAAKTELAAARANAVAPDAKRCKVEAAAETHHPL